MNPLPSTLFEVSAKAHNRGIYKITFTGTKHVYVGSSVSFRKRKNAHLNHLKQGKHVNTFLQNCFNKYGEDRTNFALLRTCHKDDLLRFEQHYIDTLKPDLNVCRVAGNLSGLKHTEENKRKFGEMSKTRWMDEDYRRKMLDKRAQFFKSAESEEYKKSIGDQSRERWLDDDYRNNVLSSRAVKMQTEEYRKKQGEDSKKRFEDEDYRNNWLSVMESKRQDDNYRDAHRRGVLLAFAINGEEIKKKISAASKAMWQDEEFRKRRLDEMHARCRTDEHRNKIRERSKKPILKLSVDGEFIQRYPSIRDALSELGLIGAAQITNCLRGRREMFKGYRWQYENLPTKPTCPIQAS